MEPTPAEQQARSPSRAALNRRPDPRAEGVAGSGRPGRTLSARSPLPRWQKGLPRAPRPHGPEGRGAVSRAEGPRICRTSTLGPTATAASLPSAYPGSVVAHHHLPALAVHCTPGGEPPLPPHSLQPPPTAAAARPFPLPPTSSQPLLGLNCLSPAGSNHRPHSTHRFTDGLLGKGGYGREETEIGIYDLQ